MEKYKLSDLSTAANFVVKSIIVDFFLLISFVKKH